MTLPEKLRDVRASIGLEWDARHRQYVFDVATEAADEIERLRSLFQSILMLNVAARYPADPNDPYPEPQSGDLPKPAYAARWRGRRTDDYWRGHRQGRMMSRIDRCVCTFDEAGNGPIDVCAEHKAWMEKAVAAERARCADVANLYFHQARPLGDESVGDCPLTAYFNGQQLVAQNIEHDIRNGN